MQNIKTRHSKILPTPITAHKYQQPIILKAVEKILKGENGLVIQPTATGKSTEAAFISRICILSHKMKGLYLYNENEGLKQARASFEYIYNGNDIKCANFFGTGKDYSVAEADMVFASFQSLNNNHEKWFQMFDPKHFDFIIVNEAHCGKAETYEEVLNYFTCSKIGMTATPERMDGKDILDIFTEKIAEIPLEEALVNGWIAGIDYRIHSHNISTQKLKKICHDVLEEGLRISIKQLNETIFVEGLDKEVFKTIYQNACPVDDRPKQTLIFCEGIPHAKNVFKLLQEDGKSAGIIHSELSDKYNDNTMKSFRKGEIQFLVSIDKLNQDIDVPEAEVCAFLRSTSSLTVFTQQLGRMLRLTPWKRKAIILDFVANAERLILVRELMKRIEKAILTMPENEQAKLTKETFKVSGNGFDFALTSEFVDTMKLIDALRLGFYDTWQEASVAAIKLGIDKEAVKSGNIRKTYLSMYKKDLRLYSHLHIFYPDFPGYAKFLGIHFYETWQEASAAAIKLGIDKEAIRTGNVSESYKKIYKKDLRLHSNPDTFYPDFPGYAKFLGIHFYETWQEASIVAIKLGIDKEAVKIGSACKVYKSMYKNDSRLHSNPHIFYPDFPGFAKFLGIHFYETWQEASAAAIKLGIDKEAVKMGEIWKAYRSIYKKDLRLPSTPYNFYSDFPGFAKFLGIHFYETWQEASAAAIKLGIDKEAIKIGRMLDTYKNMCKGDHRLCLCPHIFYPDFPGFAKFLGINYYETWQEAGCITIKLGIKKEIVKTKSVKSAYEKIRKNDLRLPPYPKIIYSDFPGWRKCLDKIKE